MINVLLIFTIFISSIVQAKEIALTFDDAPVSSSKHFESLARTQELIKKLKALDVQGAMIFANPCKDEKNGISQLKKYVEAGHFIGNHTCSHPRLDDVGFTSYSKDAEKGDQLLSSLFIGQKFFRFPFLNESKDEKLRDQMREWLKKINIETEWSLLIMTTIFFLGQSTKLRILVKKLIMQKCENFF